MSKKEDGPSYSETRSYRTLYARIKYLDFIPRVMPSHWQVFQIGDIGWFLSQGHYSGRCDNYRFQKGLQEDELGGSCPERDAHHWDEGVAMGRKMGRMLDVVVSEPQDGGVRQESSTLGFCKPAPHSLRAHGGISYSPIAPPSPPWFPTVCPVLSRGESSIPLWDWARISGALALAPGRCEISSGSSKEGKKATPAERAFWYELLFAFCSCFCF